MLYLLHLTRLQRYHEAGYTGPEGTEIQTDKLDGYYVAGSLWDM